MQTQIPSVNGPNTEISMVYLTMFLISNETCVSSYNASKPVIKIFSNVLGESCMAQFS